MPTDPRDAIELPPSPTPRLVWRCLECGYIGTLATHDLPESCPDCAAPRTEFEYVRED